MWDVMMLVLWQEKERSVSDLLHQFHQLKVGLSSSWR